MKGMWTTIGQKNYIEWYWNGYGYLLTGYHCRGSGGGGRHLHQPDLMTFPYSDSHLYYVVSIDVTYWLYLRQDIRQSHEKSADDFTHPGSSVILGSAVDNSQRLIDVFRKRRPVGAAADLADSAGQVDDDGDENNSEEADESEPEQNSFPIVDADVFEDDNA